MPQPSIDQAFITKFNDDVHLAFQQRKSKLRGTVRTDADVQASKVRFQKLGAIVAQAKTRHGDIPPSNGAHTWVEATMVDRYTLDYVDKLDLTKLSIPVRAGYVQNHSSAFARETDDQILASMVAGATVTFGSYSGNLTRNNVLGWIEGLDTADVDDDMQRWAAISMRGWNHLMCIPEFTNSQYVGPDLPWAKHVEARTWNGVHWIKHNRLPGKGTSQVKFYLWHTIAVGHGIADEVDITWDWENPKKSWSAAGSMSMGAVVIDPTGLVEGHFDDTAALP